MKYISSIMLLPALLCGCNHLRTTTYTLAPDGTVMSKTEVVRDANPMGKTEGDFRFSIGTNGTVDIRATRYSQQSADSWGTILEKLAELTKAIAEAQATPVTP